jgi:formylglycine-generating enzyme required for sulfatase activity
LSAITTITREHRDMTRVEKTVFISYRRTDFWPALAVFKDLTQHGYDAFIDYDGIASGDFEGAILDNIRARAHFVILLTPTALERCNEPADWLRREIEAAIAHKRNIVPLLLDGFEFGSPLAVERLQGPLEPLTRYQGLQVPREFFDEAMGRLRGKRLAVPVDAVLHPPSIHAQQVAQQQHEVASKAAGVVAPPPIVSGTTFRDKLKDGGEGPLMVVVPAGRFRMGSPPDEPGRIDDEGPQHDVIFAQPFALGVYAVTFDDYDRFCERTKRDKPSDQSWGRLKRPVIHVSWDDAQDYCRWLTDQTGRTYRLSSEAEWEYACRAGTTTPFHFGERITSDEANFNGDGTYNGSAKGEYRERTVEAGSFPPNAFGLYDMHGNVWEWCQDRWHGNYNGAPGDGSAWDSGDDPSRVLRGGSWYNYPWHCRAAFRNLYASAYRSFNLGFRVCCGAPIEPLNTGVLDAGTRVS